MTQDSSQHVDETKGHEKIAAPKRGKDALDVLQALGPLMLSLVGIFFTKTFQDRDQKRQAEVTVAFMAEFATGNVTDVWTFERNLDSSDPNWLLVATSGELPE